MDHLCRRFVHDRSSLPHSFHFLLLYISCLESLATRFPPSDSLPQVVVAFGAGVTECTLDSAAAIAH